MLVNLCLTAMRWLAGKRRHGTIHRQTLIPKLAWDMGLTLESWDGLSVLEGVGFGG